MIQRPNELARAELIVSMLERFGGYTYSTLMDEDPELLRVCKIAQHGLKTGGEGSGGE